MTHLKQGNSAPAFTGPDQDGKLVSLNDFAGKKVILYFYPKDNTPGCTAESCNLNDNYSYWQQQGYEVIGVSPDSVASHRKFADKYGLNFTLISDTETRILQDYGVWGEKSMYGKKYMGVMRTTFIIDEGGIILEIFEKVETGNHTGQIRKTLNI